MTIDKDEVNHFKQKIEGLLSPHGFEVHPFLTGWYNDFVSPKFHLEYPENTLAFIIISQPSMFEDAFIPFLKTQYKDTSSLRDPIDECMLHYFSSIHDLSPSVVTLHDFQLTPTRRPKILVQTAGHVAGAVKFYKPQDYSELSEKKFYPVCHHPVWGGWFALRGVAIFTDVQTQLARMEPPENLSHKEAVDMITLYNECWQDWRWRDVGRKDISAARYSAQQIKYFETSPADRFKIIDDLINQNKND